MRRVSLLSGLLLLAACGASTGIKAGSNGSNSTAPVAETTMRSTSVPTTAADVTTSTVSSGSRANPVPKGLPVSVGDGWMMKVVAYTPDANAAVAAENRYNDAPKPGMQYVMATVELTYTDAGKDDKSTPFLVSIKAVGPSNVSYSLSDSMAVAPNALESMKEIFKGGTVTGNIVFAVPSAEANQIILYASAGYGNDDIYFATK